MHRLIILTASCLSIIFTVDIVTPLDKLSAETLNGHESENQRSTVKNIKYPNGIPEHKSIGKQNESFFNLPIETQPDPTVRIGPGVIMGPDVYVNGKPMQNPLLKDVLPANHPLLTHPENSHKNKD